MTTPYSPGSRFAKAETVAGISALAVVTPPTATSFESFVLDGTLSATNVTEVAVTVAPPTSLGTVGTIKVRRDDGATTELAYIDRDGVTFTIASTDFSANNATDGNPVLVGIEWRIVVTDWSISSISVDAAAQTGFLATNAATPMTIKVWNLHATPDGQYSSDISNVHYPLPAGESLMLDNSDAQVTSDITVGGYFVPHTTSVLTGGYVYGTP